MNFIMVFTVINAIKRAAIRSNGKVVGHRTLQYRKGADNTRARKCTVFHCTPWNFKENRILGHTLWIPSSMNELIENAKMRANIIETSSYCILSEDGSKIDKVDMIENDQILFLVAKTGR